jgi:hypothetical protein
MKDVNNTLFTMAAYAGTYEMCSVVRAGRLGTASNEKTKAHSNRHACRPRTNHGCSEAFYSATVATVSPLGLYLVLRGERNLLGPQLSRNRWNHPMTDSKRTAVEARLAFPSIVARSSIFVASTPVLVLSLG